MDPDIVVGDISASNTRRPTQPLPNLRREVLDSINEREHGNRHKKTVTVASTLKACAEDELVKKEFKEMRCEIPGLTKSTFLMVFSPDGTKMASTHGNHNVYVTDLRTGKNIKTLIGHPRTPWCVAFHPSSNQILASGCLGGQVRIWDLSGGSEVWTAESQTVISSLAFHPVDRLLVIATYNELYFWDWSQPKPFMQTCTNNAKEKVRYVTFDRLGHKLITGIANTPQGFNRWERVRAPVPLPRHTDRLANYRRRITPRLVPPPQLPSATNLPETNNQTSNSNSNNNNNNIQERERRIAACYRNLVEQYELLVHRYLEVHRPANTIDRGTDPMEAEHLNPRTSEPEPTSTTALASTSSATPSSSTTVAASTSTTEPIAIPGPSGLSRPPPKRPNKRPGTPGTKSDSSTVYQSDSSSSSSSDESPTPKRRISFIPNALRMKSAPNFSPPKNVGSKVKKTVPRLSAFTSRTNNTQTLNTSGLNTSARRLNPNPRLIPELRRPEPEQTNSNSNPLPFALRRLRDMLYEGSLSSEDEVINFSERPSGEETTNDNLNVISETDNIYSHILSDLETSLRVARSIAARPETETNNVNSNNNNNNGVDTSNLLSTFSERLENVMNQSDAILANLRRSLETLTETTAQTLAYAPTLESGSSSNTSRNPPPPPPPPSLSSFHHRHCANVRHSENVNTQTYPGSGRTSRYFRIRQPRFSVRIPRGSVMIPQVWRPFDDHSYPRDPERNSESASSNIEPIRNLLTLSPRSPSTEDPIQPPTSPLLAPFATTTATADPFLTSEHNYPLPNPLPQPEPLNSPSENPIADHTYPRDPQNPSNNPTSDYITPLVSSLHSTISHISIQTNLVRRQVENIEMIDRARFEVVQLQELRQMWNEIRRHLTADSPRNEQDRQSYMLNVREMMAWTRISDPSSESSTEQSTPDRPTPSTSHSSASSSTDSRPPPPPPPSSFANRFRQCQLKKRIYWKRRLTKYENPRRYMRGHCYREVGSRPGRIELPTDHSNLSDVTVSFMIRGLEHLLAQQARVLSRRDGNNAIDRNRLECRVRSEILIQNRLRDARLRLNRVNGTNGNTNLNFVNLEEPVTYSSMGNRNDLIRYEARLRLSIYIEILTKYIENHSRSIPNALREQIKSILEMALLLTDLLLLQIIESIPSVSLDPILEQNLTQRIMQMVNTLLQNRNTRSAVLIRVLIELRAAAGSSYTQLRRDNNNTAQLNHNAVDVPNPAPPPPLLPPAPRPPEQPGPSSNTTSESSMSHIYRLGDLLARLRNVRSRLEQVSQNRLQAPSNSSSTTEQEPTRSADESPSDRESEPFEGFQSQWDQPLHDSRGSLYRTQHINLYPPDPPSSSQSSPERVWQPPIGARPWNIPAGDGSGASAAPRHASELRTLSAATGLFRPRFLVPSLYAGVNPFDADLDDPQREGPIGYDGIVTATVSPNHRIQMWDISKCNIPNISNHEKNIVVSECKIHNDGSVDISSDGTLLVTLLPSGGYLNVTNRLGIYSIKWDTLGQCLYTTSFEQNAISVSLSPLSRHLIVGLASRRVSLLPSDRWTMARIFLLDDRNVKLMGRGRLVILRELVQGRERDINFMSVNCIKWIPVSGQGIAYATNTGQLKVLT